MQQPSPRCERLRAMPGTPPGLYVTPGEGTVPVGQAGAAPCSVPPGPGWYSAGVLWGAGTGPASPGASGGGLGREGRMVALSLSLMAFGWLSTQLLASAFAPVVHLTWGRPHALPLVSGDGGHEAVRTKQPRLILPSPNASLKLLKTLLWILTVQKPRAAPREHSGHPVPADGRRSHR